WLHLRCRCSTVRLGPVGMPLRSPSPGSRAGGRSPERAAGRQTASVTKPPADEGKAESWLLLMHQIPPKPGYLRVKIWRRLQALGAVAIKKSVYPPPHTDDPRGGFDGGLPGRGKGGGGGTRWRGGHAAGGPED